MNQRLTIVEDDLLILQLLTNFIKDSGKFETIDTFSSGTEFIEAITNNKIQPDIIILDFKLGQMTAETILQEIQPLENLPPIILLTSHYNLYLVGYMVKLGIAAYLPKNIEPKTLLDVIHEVLERGHYILPEQFAHLKEALTRPNDTNYKSSLDISEKEIQLLYLLANQLTAKEIAEKLFVSPKTIEGYKNNLYIKTGTKSIVGLVLFALQHGYINIDAVQIGIEK